MRPKSIFHKTRGARKWNYRKIVLSSLKNPRRSHFRFPLSVFAISTILTFDSSPSFSHLLPLTCFGNHLFSLSSSYSAFFFWFRWSDWCENCRERVKGEKCKMLDINLFREEKGGNPEKIRESQRRRFADVKIVDEVIELDKAWRQRECLIQNIYCVKSMSLVIFVYL